MIIANGCVVTLKNSVADSSAITSTQTIGRAINDGIIKIESGRYICTTDSAFWAGGKNETGHIIVENGEITAQEYAIGVGKDSSIVVENGTLTGLDNAVLGGNGSSGYEGATITVNGGQLNGHIQTVGYTGCGIYMPNDGVVIVNGGQFNIDGVGIAARAGQININGGEFVSTVTSEGWVGDKKTQLSANGVYYDGAANYPGLQGFGSLSITGGTYRNTAAEEINIAIPAVKVTQPTNGISVNIDITAEGWPVAE